MPRSRSLALLAVVLALGCGAEPSGIVLLAPDDAGGGPDAGLSLASHDAATVPSCEDACRHADPCELARCERGECVRERLLDGTECGEGGSRICVAGACVARGCGDGYREPGGSGAAPELCDLGAASSLCIECAPAVAPLADLSALATDDVALAFDGSGALLVVAVERGEGDATLFARAFDARLRPVGARVVVARGERRWASLAPAVAGLPRGWAIAFEREAQGIEVRVLGGGGALSPRVPFGEDSHRFVVAPSIAALADGFVVAVDDAAGSADDPLGGVRAQLFDASGLPRSLSFALAADRRAVESEVAIASVGDAWIAAWTALDPARGTSVVRARELAGRAFVGPEVDVSSEGRSAREPRAARVGEGALALTWIESDGAGSTLAGRAPGVELPAPLPVSSSRPIVAAELVPRAGSSAACVYIEGVRDPVLRAPGATELELALGATGGVMPRWATGALGALAAWPEPGTGRLLALLVPSHGDPPE